jgi:hypothetical protein
VDSACVVLVLRIPGEMNARIGQVNAQLDGLEQATPCTT